MPRPDPVPPPDTSARSVLLVEDHEDNREIYSLILERHGYDVVVAPTGEEAVRMARESMPALILMDISLPGINGWTATQMIRRMAGGIRVPIIALTAHVLPEHRRHAEVVGLNGFIPKPCEPRRLIEEVSRYLPEREG